MYKGHSQGDGKHNSFDQELFNEILEAANCPSDWNGESKELDQTQQPPKVIGTKKVLTRKGNHIGESMKLSERLQKILDCSLDATLKLVEQRYENFTTNNSTKDNRK